MSGDGDANGDEGEGGDPTDGGSDGALLTDGGSDDGSARWRCEWCEKPHEKNDPPCDNCGHHKFERAVVPVAPDAPDHEPEPVWVCPECGRQHQKNSPPCSRCGNPGLEKHVPDETDYAEELGGTSYLDILEPRYVAGFAFALVAGGVLVLAMAGVITLPGMDGGVPGSADSVHGVSLADTESAYVTELNERREAAGLGALERRDGVDDGARVLNRGIVSRWYDDEGLPSRDRVREELGGACDGSEFEWAAFQRPPGEADDPVFDSPDAFASALVEGHERQDETFFETANGRVGVDVHAGPDDRVFVTVVAC
jgi:hypothetical protein